MTWQKTRVKEVSAQGLEAMIKSMSFRRTHLRYDGTDSVDRCRFRRCRNDERRRSKRLHRQRFGFVPEGRKLVVDALAVEAVSALQKQSLIQK